MLSLLFLFALQLNWVPFVFVSGHTHDICVEVSGTTVTFWGGPWDAHGYSVSPTGGVILSNGPSGNGRYDFTETVVDAGGVPSGVDLTNFVCTSCDQGRTNHYWQKVVIEGLTCDATYEVTTTSDTAIEAPGCGFPDITIPPCSCLPECDSDPCQCDDTLDGFEDPFCEICHSNGCDECMDVGNYWKLDYNYPCISCDDEFDGCLFCQDFNGCGQCEDGYIRQLRENCEFYECVQDPDYVPRVPGPEPTNCPTYHTIDNCNENNCVGGENSHCGNQQSWGCASCNYGYWQLSHQHPCTACSDITGCTSCNDFQGCTACGYGSDWYWDTDCTYGRCNYKM